MSERKTLTKLNVGGGDDLYLLTTTIGEDEEEGFDLALSDGVKSWTGSCKCFKSQIHLLIVISKKVKQQVI